MVTNDTRSPIETYILELTNKCNERCAFCYSISFDSTTGKTRSLSRLSGDEWKSCLDSIVDGGASAVDFSGGEPTLHPDFKEVLQYAKDKGLYTIVSTNGATFYNNRIRESLDENADCVALSMHGVGNVHDEIKKLEGSYDKVAQAYRHFARNGKKTKVNTVACAQNLELVPFIGLALDIENSPAQWKISQSVCREAGFENKNNVGISNKEFFSLKESLKQKFPITNDEGRLIFREDDSQMDRYQFSPYLIADSSGSLYVPVGEKHIPLGISLLDGDLSKIEDKLHDYEKFSEELRENHRKFYGR